ncbi:hypothetical protein AAFF_G00132760 [Aldrovandia affinis]|uniref:Glycosyl transferase CAP10 domain-containing protein n=1 Tax=Aldrovandia affinis TaxID=143900 RepID=A0AAD7RQQ2_9TELE|nr:hypothetical protein AAFF_G00132760 [Aldrovandia affinis]
MTEKRRDREEWLPGARRDGTVSLPEEAERGDMGMMILLLLLLLLFFPDSQGAAGRVDRVYVREGEVGLLRCRLSAEPGDGDVFVEWEVLSLLDPSGPVGVLGPGGQSARPVIQQSETLLIVNATQRDEGIYTCALRNASGILRPPDRFNLTVFRDSCYTPAALYSREEGHVGESHTVQCLFSCDGIPLCSITWRKDCTSSFPGNRRMNVYIENVQMGDAGKYTCTRSYWHGSQMFNMSATFDLTVTEAGLTVDPRIVEPQDNDEIEVDMGKAAVIPCRAVYRIKPELEFLENIFWVNVSEDLSQPVYYNETVSGGELREDRTYHRIAWLVFRSVSPVHLNTKYTCRLQSGYGGEDVSITLKQRVVAPSRVLWLRIVGGVCVATAALLVVVYVKLRMDIVLFLRRLLRRTSWSASDGKRYDAYIMRYKASVEEALTEEEQTLIPHVLETHFGYQLCLYDRDVPVGGAVSEVVLESIEQSHRLLLLPSALEPGSRDEAGLGGEYALLSGLHAALVDRQTRLVLVERAPRGQLDSLPEALRLLARSGGTVAWRGESSTRLSSTFWKKLRFRMSHRRLVEEMLGELLCLLCCLGLGLGVQTPPAEFTASAASTLVWGPGLEAGAVLPARFFFVQAVASGGRNVCVKIVAPGEPFSRIWVQVLDRRDGSLLVRYRMYASYPALRVEILLKGTHAAKSPYIIKGPVYHESCDCPVTSAGQWLQHMHCPSSFPQILRDLSVFPSVDPDRNAQDIPRRFGQRQSLCHYTIKDNQVYIKTHGEHVGFRIFMDAFLLSLTRKVRVPDVEFFVNLGDWPLEKRRPPEPLHPIFSWCGSNDTRDIVMPTYDLTESVLETMGRVSLDMMSVQANTGPPWEEKNGTAFWRGRDSRKERLELVKLGRAHPHMVDAAFTNFFFFKHDEGLYGPLVKHVSFFDFFKFKYQINVDGTVAAYRLPYLLAGDSVVLKQDSLYYEHFYGDLRPWEHYIPFKSDLSDLLDKVRWAREHDQEARKIAMAAQQFVRTNLMGDSIFCYYFKLFQEYSRLQVSEARVREGMELVEQPKDDLFPCSCHRRKVAKVLLLFWQLPVWSSQNQDLGPHFTWDHALPDRSREEPSERLWPCCLHSPFLRSPTARGQCPPQPVPECRALARVSRPVQVGPGLHQPGQAVVGGQLEGRDLLQEDQDQDVAAFGQQPEGGQTQLQGAPVAAEVGPADQAQRPAAGVQAVGDVVHDVLAQLEVAGVEAEAEEGRATPLQLGEQLLQRPALVPPAVRHERVEAEELRLPAAGATHCLRLPAAGDVDQGEEVGRGQPVGQRRQREGRQEQGRRHEQRKPRVRGAGGLGEFEEVEGRSLALAPQGLQPGVADEDLDLPLPPRPRDEPRVLTVTVQLRVKQEHVLEVHHGLWNMMSRLGCWERSTLTSLSLFSLTISFSSARSTNPPERLDLNSKSSAFLRCFPMKREPQKNCLALINHVIASFSGLQRTVEPQEGIVAQGIRMAQRHAQSLQVGRQASQILRHVCDAAAVSGGPQEQHTKRSTGVSVEARAPVTAGGVRVVSARSQLGHLGLHLLVLIALEAAVLQSALLLLFPGDVTRPFAVVMGLRPPTVPLMRGKLNITSSSALENDSWMMVLHSWAFWKPVSRAMTDPPVPGLTHEACQQEAQAESRHGVDDPDDPEGGGDDPGGLVQHSAHHRDDDDEDDAQDGAHLSTHGQPSELANCEPPSRDRPWPSAPIGGGVWLSAPGGRGRVSRLRSTMKHRRAADSWGGIFFAILGHLCFTYIPRATGTNRDTSVMPEETLTYSPEFSHLPESPDCSHALAQLVCCTLCQDVGAGAPGQQPMMRMATACTGSTSKASASAKAQNGMMPNWHRKPTKMPQGRRTCPHSLGASTVQPMENMTMASMTVSTALSTMLRISLKLLGGTRQEAPEHSVALGRQARRGATGADIVGQRGGGGGLNRGGSRIRVRAEVGWGGVPKLSYGPKERLFYRPRQQAATLTCPKCPRPFKYLPPGHRCKISHLQW